jgi:glycosyltransferase involved in cell wall biosynthesis
MLDLRIGTKVAFVAPWYGDIIPGGAESLCRGVAKALLSIGVSVEVLTTCVEKFLSDWNHDFHPEGKTVENGVIVRRFKVRQRDTARFDAVNYKLMHNQPVSAGEEQVFIDNMVNSTRLCEYIRQHREEYVFLFIPYMFGTTYWGIRECADRAILIPCLHDEPYARMTIFRQMCQSVRGLFFNSATERDLAENLYDLDRDRLIVTGVPVTCDWSSDPIRFKQKYGLSKFLLYAGRTDKGKQADLLIEHFCRYLEDTRRDECLVFIGGGDVEIPTAWQSRILQLGFVPAQDKFDAYGAATALCVPSTMESFSIVMMESWLAGRPVIVNQQCAVTTSFCLESNGGLFFSDYVEFREILLTLNDDPELCAALGSNGRQYVLSHFHPRAVAYRYLEAITSLGLVS